MTDVLDMDMMIFRLITGSPEMFQSLLFGGIFLSHAYASR